MHINDNTDKITTPFIIKLIIFAGGLAVGFLFLRIFITPFTISDESMSQNYHKGELVIVLKHFTPKRGKTVLYEFPVDSGNVLCKRVIAAEGDRVEIVDKTILINGGRKEFQWKTSSIDNRVLPSPFSHRDNMDQIIISKDEYFMMGDNLDFSFDSRETGSVKKKNIIGYVLFKI